MIGAAAEAQPAQGRVQPIFLEGKLLPLPAATAAELNLHDGQVVQAIVRSSGGEPSLMFRGKLVDMPAALLSQFSAGRSIWLRVVERPDGNWGLLPLHQVGTSEPTVSRIANLLYRPASGDLSSLLNGQKMAELLQGLARPELQAQWRGLQLSMAQLSPDALRNALMGAMGSEAWLGRGRLNPAMDPKQFLRKLLSLMEEQDSDTDPNASLVRRAIDSLEANQVQSVQAQAQREVLFSLTLPFVDANPAELVFRRAPQREGEPPVFTVNVHSKSEDLGPVWLQTQLTGNQRVDLTMWALQAHVVEQARARQGELGSELSAAGLNLQSFRVVHGERPAVGAEWTPSGRGLVVDINA
jgi:hypothetical protein